MAEPSVETSARDDDGFRTAAALFGFYLACMGLAAYLYSVSYTHLTLPTTERV